MAKCPKCGRKIDFLVERVVVEEDWEVILDGSILIWNENLDERLIESDGYFCPECNRLVAMGYDEALKILKT